jgi:hypothetical protein
LSDRELPDFDALAPVMSANAERCLPSGALAIVHREACGNRERGLDCRLSLDAVRDVDPVETRRGCAEEEAL